MFDQRQWTPGAQEAHTWLEPWSAATVRALLLDADEAGWRSHVIDSDCPGKSLRGQDDRVSSAIVDGSEQIELLLAALHDDVDRQRREQGSAVQQVLVVVGESRSLVWDPRLLGFARYGRVFGIHLAVDRAVEGMLTAAPLPRNGAHNPVFGRWFCSNIEGHRVG